MIFQYTIAHFLRGFNPWVDGSNYAGKIRRLDFRFAQQIFDEFRSGRRLAFGSIAPTGDAGPGSSQA
jgi:phage tail tube protein FII